MTNTIKSIICFLFLLTIINSKSTAHPGGHYTKDDISFLHHWNVKANGRQVIGNFMMFKNNLVFIEGINGNEWTIPMNELKGNDLEYTNNEISKIATLNGIVPAIKNDTNENMNSAWSSRGIWILFLTGFFAIAFYTLTVYVKRKNYNVRWRFAFSSLTIASMILFFISCKKNNDVNGTNTDPGYIPRTSIGLLDSAFSLYAPSVTTGHDNNYYLVYSNGFPNHNMMVGITSWQQQVPIPQYYNLDTNHWSIPLQPVYADVPLSTRTNFMKGAVAIAVNGIPIFNALNNRGEDAFTIGELDQWGGHCGRADDYHYHAAPLSLSTTSGLRPIAFALDGFAVYGAKEPDGSPMQALDSCHGHVIGNGVYHYHGTNTYPYVVGAMKGRVTLDPTTPAPENQILPQAFAKPCRNFLNPLLGASISNFVSPGTNAYNLTYNIANKPGHVNYHWIPTATADTFYFEFIDTGGVTTTAKYTRRK